MRYAEIIISLSIPKGSVDINLKKSRKKGKCESCFLILNSKFELSTTLVFSFSDIFRAEY